MMKAAPRTGEGGVLVGMNEPFFLLPSFFLSFFFQGSIHPLGLGKRVIYEERKIGRWGPTMNRFMIELNSSVLSLWGEVKYNLIMLYGKKWLLLGLLHLHT